MHALRVFRSLGSELLRSKARTVNSIQPQVATKPNWIEEEFERRAQSQPAALDDAARERAFQKAAQARWSQLMQEVQTDVGAFSRRAGATEFRQASDHEFHVIRAPLTLLVKANIAEHNIGYEYQSDDTRAEAAPEGGIFSIRLSRYGRAELYSADERLSDEEARRMLLELVLFPPQPAV